MKDFGASADVRELCATAANMYRLGWDERNGGNISMLLSDGAAEEYFGGARPMRVLETGFNAAPLASKCILVTGTGKYFKNVERAPEVNLGVIRITADGAKAEVLWGFTDGGRPTSELPAHLMTHIERLKADPLHTVVTHCHPAHILAMTYVHSLDERELTHTLWQMCTECIVVFPDGVGALPWMVCGTNEIGRATADKMKRFRIVVWGQHGIYGVGRTLDEAFGLIETVEKAAEIYLLTAHLPRINTITDAQLRELAAAFKVDARLDFLDS